MKNLIIFCVFGSIYLNIEIFFKAFKNIDLFGYALIGYTSIWMFPIGGIAALLVGLINENLNIPLLLECLIGGIIITTIEFVSGLFFNIHLGLNLWDYSDLPFNVEGQVCLFFTLAWCILVPVIHWTDDIVRKELNHG